MYNSSPPLGDTGDFKDGDFYGFFGDFAQNRERWEEEMKFEIEGREEIIDRYSSDTKERKEAQAKYGKLKVGLETKIGLSLGFEGLSEKLDKWGEERKWEVWWKWSKGIRRNLPQIPE